MIVCGNQSMSNVKHSDEEEWNMEKTITRRIMPLPLGRSKTGCCVNSTKECRKSFRIFNLDIPSWQFRKSETVETSENKSYQFEKNSEWDDDMIGNGISEEECCKRRRISSKKSTFIRGNYKCNSNGNEKSFLHVGNGNTSLGFSRHRGLSHIDNVIRIKLALLQCSRNRMLRCIEGKIGDNRQNGGSLNGKKFPSCTFSFTFKLRKSAYPRFEPYPSMQAPFTDVANAEGKVKHVSAATQTSMISNISGGHSKQSKVGRKGRKSIAKTKLAMTKPKAIRNHASDLLQRKAIWVCPFCEYEDLFGCEPIGLIQLYEFKEREARRVRDERQRLLQLAKNRAKNKKSRPGKTSNVLDIRELEREEGICSRQSQTEESSYCTCGRRHPENLNLTNSTAFSSHEHRSLLSDQFSAWSKREVMG